MYFKIPEKLVCLILRALLDCAYTIFFEWSNFSFLRNSQWITLLINLYLVLYSFCANLLHLFIMWLIVSYQSPHNLHLLFCCVLSILALIWFPLITLFCVAIRKDLIYLLKFPFLSQIHEFSCEKSIDSRLKRLYSCFSSPFFLNISVLLILVLSILFLVAVINLPLYP